MATSTLNFQKAGDVWAAKFTSSGNAIIELERKDRGVVSVLANLTGMREVPVAQYQNPYVADVILKLDIPAGVEVTIKSQSEVIASLMLAV